jgi:cysteine desulfuration protein SufE
MTIDDIIESFALLDDWEDRYRYVIELGRALQPLPDDLRTETNKVHGCASQVWLATAVQRDVGAEPRLEILGDSDAHIVRGLVAILLALCSGKNAKEVLELDPTALFERLGLREHLTPQRSNGFKSMVARIRADARAAVSEVSAN